MGNAELKKYSNFDDNLADVNDIENAEDSEDKSCKKIKKTKLGTIFHKTRRLFKRGVEDGAGIALFSGLVGICDYIGPLSFNLDHPMGDIALGSGMYCGGSSLLNRTSGMVTSFAGLGISISPEIYNLASSGDLNMFLKNSASRLVCFGIGGVIGSILCAKSAKEYNGMIEFGGEFCYESDAKRARDYLEKIINSSNYISSSESSISEVSEECERYSVSARIVGKKSELSSYLRTNIEKYFESSNKPCKYSLSEILTIKKSD